MVKFWEHVNQRMAPYDDQITVTGVQIINLPGELLLPW
jgi:hypothetical protein